MVSAANSSQASSHCVSEYTVDDKIGKTLGTVSKSLKHLSDENTNAHKSKKKPNKQRLERGSRFCGTLFDQF